jgi:hypothetical protein
MSKASLMLNQQFAFDRNVDLIQNMTKNSKFRNVNKNKILNEIPLNSL